MKVIFGLGNPEAKYDSTRHNVGFWAIDRLAEEWGGTFKSDRKLKANITEVMVQGEKVLLVKPAVYYNESGIVARAVADYYKLELDDLLVIHDELMIDFGTVRTRKSGRDAGNNGIKSLLAHLGNEEFARIRVGIGTAQRSLSTDHGFVLGRFTHDEQVVLQEKLWPIIFGFLQQFIGDKLENHSVSIEK